jgi:hypothetical protein
LLNLHFSAFSVSPLSLILTSNCSRLLSCSSWEGACSNIFDEGADHELLHVYIALTIFIIFVIFVPKLTFLIILFVVICFVSTL